MFCLAVLVVPVLLSLMYGWFGWPGPVILIAVVCWLYWQGSKNDRQLNSKASNYGMNDTATNPAGHKKPRDPSVARRKYGKRYHSKYTNWRVVAKRENYICHICLRQVDENDFTRDSSNHFIAGADYPTVDHLLPKSRGGSHHWTNLKLAHKSCNSEKGTRTTDEFKAVQFGSRVKKERKHSSKKRDKVEELILKAALQSTDGTFKFLDVQRIRDSDHPRNDIGDAFIRSCLSSTLNASSSYCAKAVVTTVSIGKYRLYSKRVQ